MEEWTISNSAILRPSCMLENKCHTGYLLILGISNYVVFLFLGCVFSSSGFLRFCLIHEIRGRTNIGMFDKYNLIRWFLCASLVENHRRVCFMGVHGTLKIGEEWSPGCFWNKGSLDVGWVSALDKSSEDAKTSTVLHKSADNSSEIASPSGILGMGGGSEVNFKFLLSVPGTWLVWCSHRDGTWLQ